MRLFFLFMICISVSAVESLELDVFGLSYHFNRDYDFNERNPGLGLTAVLTDSDDFIKLRWVASGGFYEDSYSATATYLMFGVRATLGDDDSFHTALSLQAGYLNGSGHKGAGAFPVLSFGYDRFDLCITGDPFSKNETVKTSETTAVAYSKMVGVFLKIRVLDF